MDIFNKRILVLISSSWTQCFRVWPPLHQSFPFQPQSIIWYHSAWCTPISIIIQGLQSSRLYPRFTEFLSLSRVYRVPISIQDLQSSCLYPGFKEFPSLSRVIVFPSLSRIYRVPVSIQGLQSSHL